MCIIPQAQAYLMRLSAKSSAGKYQGQVLALPMEPIVRLSHA